MTIQNQSWPRCSLKSILYLVCVLAASSSHYAAAYVTIYGGPEYSSLTDTGYSFSYQQPGRIVNVSGTAVGSAEKYSTGNFLGGRAVRWDGSGSAAVELGILGDNSGLTSSSAYSINSNGTTVGDSSKYVRGAGLGSRAVRWDATTTNPAELGSLGTDNGGATQTEAFAINNGGTIVGYAQKYVSGIYIGDRAVRWDGAGTIATELDLPGGYFRSVASLVNDTGTVIGYAYPNPNDLGLISAVRWASGGTSVALLDYPTGGFIRTYPLAVNKSSITVGYADRSSNDRSAVRWNASGTSVVVLDRLGTGQNGFGFAVANALNDSGTAVGTSEKYSSGTDFGHRAVRWDGLGTGVTELANLGTDNVGSTLSSANAINNSGIAVGWANTYLSGNFDDTHAVAWANDGSVIDLNSLISPDSGWILVQAYGISDSDWISGLGRYDPDGPGGNDAYDRLFLIQIQIPEPSTLVLAAFGVVAYLARRRCSN